MIIILFCIYLYMKHYCRIRQSMIGPDDAAMDLRAARLHAQTTNNQEVGKTSAALPWLNWQSLSSLFVILCAIGGAILFAFLVIISSDTSLIAINQLLFYKSTFFKSTTMLHIIKKNNVAAKNVTKYIF